MHASMVRGLSLALLMALNSPVVTAQASPLHNQVVRILEGTTFVLPMNQSREGVIDACGFEFNALTFDFAYKKGEPILINGSFAIRKFEDKQLYLTYKLGTFNYLNTELVPEAPNFAWMKLGDVLVKPDTSSEAEAKGYRLYISALKQGTAKGLDSIIKQDKVIVGFNRKDGGLDVVVPLDLSVRDTKMEGEKAVRIRDDKLGKGFDVCIKELLAGLR